MDLTLEKLKEYAAYNVLNRISVTGVQKKLSLGIEKKGGRSRFTIVGMWGRFVLKPPVEEYPCLPENEELVMRCAALAGIPIVPCGLVRLGSRELCFISRRIDRDKTGAKTAMEDLCQVSERLTEDKYKGSVERVGRLLRRYSVYPGIDALDLFLRAVFSFVSGNADMHLKNYSLIQSPQGIRLSPAYDLVSTVLAMPEDREETALTINGKKSGLVRADFNALAGSLELSVRQRDAMYRQLCVALPRMKECIEDSFLAPDLKQTMAALVEKRMTVFQ